MSEHPWIKRGPYPGPEHTGMPIPDDDPIVGHSTFRDGHHEPLRQSEAEAIIAASDRAKALRAEQMPDEQAAIEAMFSAWLRLKELGWREAQYCPKDGQVFDAIEPGSTGIHRCRYEGHWPTGSWWIIGDDDLYPSRPVLFRVIGSVPVLAGEASGSAHRSESAMIAPSQFDHSPSSETVERLKEEVMGRSSIYHEMNFARQHYTADEIKAEAVRFDQSIDRLISAALSQGRASEPSSEYGHSRSMNKRLKAMGKPLPEGQQLTEAFDLVAQGRASQEEVSPIRLKRVQMMRARTEVQLSVEALDHNGGRPSVMESLKADLAAFDAIVAHLASQEAEIARLKARIVLLDIDNRHQTKRAEAAEASLSVKEVEIARLHDHLKEETDWRIHHQTRAEELEQALHDEGWIRRAQNAEASLASLAEEYEKLQKKHLGAHPRHGGR